MSGRIGPVRPILTVEVSREEYDMLYRFAHRVGASVYEIVMLGTLRVINEINRGDSARDVLYDYPLERMNS